MASIIETGTAAEVVSLPALKRHCRVEHSDDDAYLASLGEAATAWVMNVAGRSLTATEWTLTLDGFPATIGLPKPPVTAVDSIVYIDANGDQQTLPHADYAVYGLNSLRCYVAPADGCSWPDTASVPDAVTVVYEAGTASVPTPITHAILLLVSFWFEHRESASPDSLRSIPMGVEALLANHRARE